MQRKIQLREAMNFKLITYLSSFLLVSLHGGSLNSRMNWWIEPVWYYKKKHEENIPYLLNKILLHKFLWRNAAM